MIAREKNFVRGGLVFHPHEKDERPRSRAGVRLFESPNPYGTTDGGVVGA